MFHAMLLGVALLGATNLPWSAMDGHAIIVDANARATSSDGVPVPPVRRERQLASIDSNYIPPTDAAAVDSILSAAGLNIADVRAGNATVPRLYAQAMPADMSAISQADERKRIFLKIMLPLVLAADEELVADHAHLIYLRSLMQAGDDLPKAEASWLDAMMKLFQVDNGDIDELIKRVDIIPPSLVLAQAAQESGWGTSRLVHQGNAVFGQRTWAQGTGIVPAQRAKGQTFEVETFQGLGQSVFAYLVNLDRCPAYKKLRDIRARMRAKGVALDGWMLAGALGDYAEEPDYVQKIRALIRTNKLTDFDAARLAALGG